MDWQQAVSIGFNIAFWLLCAVWSAAYLFNWQSHEELDDWASRVGIPGFEVTQLRLQESKGRRKEQRLNVGTFPLRTPYP
jgi:hypothetical protein|eukprot:COSAG01_NODE_16537_length_1228_cov_1.348981_2_plen_80_part_00